MMNNLLIRWLVIISIGLAGAGLLTGGAAYSQARSGAPVVVSGRLEVLVIDNFNQGIATMAYFLHADNGSVYELQFGASPPENLSTGQRVTVTGYVESNKLRVDTLKPEPNAAMPAAGCDMAAFRLQSVAV